jgi:hypothetical protein
MDGLSPGHRDVGIRSGEAPPGPGLFAVVKGGCLNSENSMTPVRLATKIVPAVIHRRELMAQRFTELKDSLREFMEKQRIFFVSTAAPDGRINVSPKGMDSLRVLGPNRIVWLNVTGSGNETAAHLLELPRMTLMFCAFEGSALILRVYGTARTLHRGDSGWDELYGLFPPVPGARQIFDLQVEMAQTSCGTAVPFFDYRADRDELNQWAAKKGEAGLRDYWRDRNGLSLDGRETGIGVLLND